MTAKGQAVATAHLDIEDLSEGADNAISFFGIQPHYDVLVAHADNTDRAAVAAVVAAVRRTGANLSVLEVKPSKPNEPFPRILFEAGKACNFFITVGNVAGLHNMNHVLQAYDYGISKVQVDPRPNFLSSEVARYPFKLFFEIQDYVRRKIAKQIFHPGMTAEFRATDELGSDLRWEVRVPDNLGGYIGATPLSVGWWGEASHPRIMARAQFPPLTLVMTDLLYSTRGSMFVDTTNFFGELESPWKFSFEGGYCVNIEGGELADQAWDLLNQFENSNRICEFMITTHPKVADKNPKYRPGMPVGALSAKSHGDFGFGLGGTTGTGGVDPAYAHITRMFGMSGGMTLTANDEVILDRGRLAALADPEVIEMAKRYGDPEYLLSLPPALEEMHRARRAARDAAGSRQPVPPSPAAARQPVRNVGQKVPTQSALDHLDRQLGSEKDDVVFASAKPFLLGVNDSESAAPFLAAYDMRLQFNVTDGDPFYAVLSNGRLENVIRGWVPDFNTRDDMEIFGTGENFLEIFQGRSTPATQMWFGKVTPRGEMGKHNQAAVTYAILFRAQEQWRERSRQS